MHCTLKPNRGDFVFTMRRLRDCGAGTLGVVVREGPPEQPYPVTVLFEGGTYAHLMEEEVNLDVMSLGARDEMAAGYQWRGTGSLEEDFEGGRFGQTFTRGRRRFPSLVVPHANWVH